MENRQASGTEVQHNALHAVTDLLGSTFTTVVKRLTGNRPDLTEYYKSRELGPDQLKTTPTNAIIFFVSKRQVG